MNSQQASTHDSRSIATLPPPGTRVLCLGSDTASAESLCKSHDWPVTTEAAEAQALIIAGTLDECLAHSDEQVLKGTPPTVVRMLLVTSAINTADASEVQHLEYQPVEWLPVKQGILLVTEPVAQKASEHDRLQQQISHLQHRLAELYGSNRYRAGDMIANAWPPSLESFWLPFRLLNLFRNRTLGGSRDESIQASIPPLSGSGLQMRHARKAFRAFRNHVREKRAEQVVFIFSGTTYIQDIQGNRPIRLAQAYLERGIPVIFSYHRWKASEKPAWSNDPDLLQLPVDLALRLMRDIAVEPFDNAERLFIVGYPLPPVLRHINRFTANGWRTLYDCRDDWEEFRENGQARWYSQAAEAYTVRNVDAVCCVSNALVEKMQAFSPNQLVALSPNAHNGSLSPITDRQSRDPGNPVFGYVGHLAEAWFDWELIIDAARRLPGTRFELIGHSAPTSLDLPANIHLLKARPMSEVGSLARHWAAALIPFKPGILSNGVDPIKVYEYLAMGLPVIATGVSQVRDYPGVTYAETGEAFVSELQREQELPEPGLLEEFLAKNTWQARTLELPELAEHGAEGNPVHALTAFRDTKQDAH